MQLGDDVESRGRRTGGGWLGSRDERASGQEIVNVVCSDHEPFATENCATQPRAIRSDGEAHALVAAQRAELKIESRSKMRYLGAVS